MSLGGNQGTGNNGGHGGGQYSLHKKCDSPACPCDEEVDIKAACEAAGWFVRDQKGRTRLRVFPKELLMLAPGKGCTVPYSADFKSHKEAHEHYSKGAPRDDFDREFMAFRKARVEEKKEQRKISWAQTGSTKV